VRVALIGPVPPTLGAATPGGVATHQMYLATGLAAQGVYAPLLATNTWVAPGSMQPLAGAAPFPLYRMGRPSWQRKEYWSAVGIGRAARYALFLALVTSVRSVKSATADRARLGSRREMLENLLWYRRFLSNVRPDVIHVQHPLDRCMYVRLVQRLERWRIPLVITAHSLFGEHSQATIETLMAPSLRAADRVIAVSPHIAEQAIKLGVDASRVRVIRSGVDLERFSEQRDRAAARAALGVAAQAPLVLFVGNLEPRKQIDVLLRAMALVRARVPEVQLVIVGSGENAGAQDQTSRLNDLTHELELTECVRFVGRVSDDQLLDYYAAADVFALPSSSEAQGIVALEAMACGLPVVATAVGGLLGTIEDGRTGYLVPPGEVAPLADRLVSVLLEWSTSRAIGAAARQAVERDFSWSRAVAATEAAYREIVTCAG
jgi:glycosyltransferase involved in cell wall biosynthesis